MVVGSFYEDRGTDRLTDAMSLLGDVCLADSPKIGENLFPTSSPPSVTPSVLNPYRTNVENRVSS